MSSCWQRLIHILPMGVCVHRSVESAYADTRFIVSARYNKVNIKVFNKKDTQLDIVLDSNEIA